MIKSCYTICGIKFLYHDDTKYLYTLKWIAWCPFIVVYRDWYQHGALLSSEEGVIIAGLLVGLNTIDYSVVMKGEDFDKPVRSDIVYMHVCVCL